MAGQRQQPIERRLRLRIALAVLQLVVGVAGLILLVRAGVNWLTLTALAVTCVLTPVRTWVKYYRAPSEE
jgi:hypothetical protein